MSQTGKERLFAYGDEHRKMFSGKKDGVMHEDMLYFTWLAFLSTLSILRLVGFENLYNYETFRSKREL
jgi:hypothetical protein